MTSERAPWPGTGPEQSRDPLVDTITGEIMPNRIPQFDQRDFLNALPPDVLRNDVGDFIQQYVAQNRHGRGPFVIRDNAQTQQLPGLTIPTWLALLLNQLCMDGRLPYNSDRPAMLRDFIVLAAAGHFQALAAISPADPFLQNGQHILAHEETLRRDLYAEELLTSYAEDLATTSRMIEMKINIGNRAAVFKDLKRLFDHVNQVTDRQFWRPALQQMLIGTPEVMMALQWLSEDESYRRIPEVTGWLAIRDMHRQVDED